MECPSAAELGLESKHHYKAGAQRRLGEHGGLTYDSSRLVLAGPAARQLALRSYKIATRRGSSRARISRVVYDVAPDAG